MKQVLLIVHLIIALIVIGLILLQNSKGGLGSGAGGGEQYRSRRGAERVVFIATIIGATFFLLTSIASILVR